MLKKQTASAPSDPPPDEESQATNYRKPWAPLTIPAYRSFWIAGLISNMGTWIHETGAQWLMTSLEPSPEMVSAVRTCMAVPVFCLALPAGVWADRVDRRTWLISSQMLLLIIAAIMTLLAALGWMNPALLLILTAAMGIAMILNQPAWQALTPELVPPALVPSAVSIGSMSFNLARSLGPALAGLLIAQFDVWVTFGFNAFSFLAVIFVLCLWKADLAEAPKRSRPEFLNELRKGMFVVHNLKEVRHALMRVFLFALPASILWSLLSLVATEKLHFQERGFGFCLALIGAGAVVGAWFIPWVRQRFSSENIVLAAQLTYAACCAIVGWSQSATIIMPVLWILGICWMASMTTLNATAQVYLPRKFRARGIAAYLMCFALGMAAGSAIWGWLAYGLEDISIAFIVAGIVMALVAMGTYPLKIGTLGIANSAS